VAASLIPSKLGPRPPGDIITIRGKVALDKDFTAGYNYRVIIEDARIVK
jgi:hypothetical protein